MNTNKKNLYTEEEEESNFVPLLKLCIRQFLHNWLWFALSVVVCLALGWLYQQSRERVYQRQAVMLIEDADPSSSYFRSSSSRKRTSMNTLMELNGVSVGDNLANEIFILSSQRLMQRVVTRLNLDVDYTMKESLHKVALYGQSRPFEVVFQDEIQGSGKSFKVKKLDNQSCKITEMKDSLGNELPDITVKLGEMVDTPAGRLCIVRGHSYANWTNEEITVHRMPIQMATLVYLSKLSAEELDKKSSLIVLTCRDIQPQRASDILSTLFDVYKEDVIENKNSVAYNTANFIDNRIQIIESELSRVETELADFKKQNRMVDFQSTSKAVIDQTTDAHQQTLQAETQLNVAKYLGEYLTDHANDQDLIPALNIGEASFNSQIATYNETMNKRNLMASNSNEEQSVVKQLDQQLDQMRNAIATSLQNFIATLELRLRDAKQNEAKLTNRVAGAPDQEKQGLDIQRQQSLKEALYTYLLNKREEVALQQAINEANVRLIEGPIGGNHPVSPRKKIILLLSLLIGFAIPTIIIWLKMALDVTVHTRADIEEVTTIPILGDIPRVKDTDAHTLISEMQANSPAVEAFRILRSGLNFLQGKKQVLMATSTIPGQGKSFISRNLGVILAMADKKVLVVDADIRKQTLSRRQQSHIGLTSYLSDKSIDVEKLIQNDAFAKGVDFLAAGPLPPNPAELLMSQRLDELFEKLRTIYDYVLIDSTPMFAVADACIVNRVADLTLFIIRVGQQNRDFLPELENLYREKRFNNLTIIVNDADINIKLYGYGPRVGYGYGYQYGPTQKKSLFKRILSHLKP